MEGNFHVRFLGGKGRGNPLDPADKIHTKNERVIHTEIQVKSIPEMIQRSLYYQSKMVTEQIGRRDKYLLIKKVVSIIITDYALPQLSGSGRYHHQFRYRTGDGIGLTDLVEINTLELTKLPHETDKTKLYDWMRFMETNDEEELKMLATKGPELKKAANRRRKSSGNMGRNREIGKVIAQAYDVAPQCAPAASFCALPGVALPVRLPVAPYCPFLKKLQIHGNFRQKMCDKNIFFFNFILTF